MNTTQISTTHKCNKLLPFNGFGRLYKETGFDAYRKRIATLLSEQGEELADDDSEMLFYYYQRGESETFVLATLGFDYCGLNC